MTTKKAIELIKKDIEFYKGQIIWMEAFSDKYTKRFTSTENSASGVMRSMVGEIIQIMSEMVNSLHENQIKHYQNILMELESKKE